MVVVGGELTIQCGVTFSYVLTAAMREHFPGDAAGDREKKGEVREEFKVLFIVTRSRAKRGLKKAMITVLRSNSKNASIRKSKNCSSN